MSEPNNNQEELVGSEAESRIKILSRRGFIFGAIAIAGGYEVLRWIDFGPQKAGISAQLRKVLDINQRVALSLFNEGSTAKLYPVSEAVMPIVNGTVGIDTPIDQTSWKLNLQDKPSADRILSLSQVKALPRTDITTELRCVEGWTTVVHWTGCKLSEFIKRYPPRPRNGNPLDFTDFSTMPKYIGFETPPPGFLAGESQSYYVGIDMKSAMHHQTLLCYAMNGNALSPPHGAPLRLVIPTKYGFKSLKRIGRIFYSDTMPRDFWAENGYDWYAGL